jgi:hypothetical protein
VYYGTWGSELFQSLYSPRAGALSSLLVAPEWHLWIAALALMSIAGLAWAPLLFAAPLLLAALGVTLVASGVGAARARSVIRPIPRRLRATGWAFATFLHLIQPLARTRGRLGGRAQRARSQARRFALPLPRAFREWTDARQPGEKRLTEIEARLRAEGAIVTRGGVYDRWDLQARHGFSGAVRIRIGIEEHGAGHQLVRVELTPGYSRGALSLIAVLVALSLIALVDGAHVAVLVLLAAAAVLGMRAVRSAGLTMGSVLEHVGASAHGDPSVRREVVKMKLEGT